MSRYVELMSPITPVDFATGEPVMVPERDPSDERKIVMKPAPPMQFMAWLFQVIGGGKDGAHPKLGKGVELADRVYRIRFSLTDPSKRHEINGKQYAEFEDGDHKAVCDVIDDFQPMNALLWAQVRPFLHAWKPEVKQDDEWKRKQTVKAVETSTAAAG